LLRLLAMSRYTLGIAVVGTFLGATALLAYGLLETIALFDAGVATALVIAALAVHLHRTPAAPRHEREKGP
jgi:hypothetical protein